MPTAADAHLKPSPLLSHFHVILVEPDDNINIGAVARAMMNLGFEHLHLVQPKSFEKPHAARSACWAAPLLDRIVVHETLEEAVAPFHDVVGFTARHSRNRRMHLLLPEWAAGLGDLPEDRQIALLFGCEESGLRNADLVHCRALVRIPSTAENPSYNLAQAVLLVLYEISRVTWEPSSPGHPAACANDLQQLDRLVSETLAHAGFYRHDAPASIPGIVSNLLRRTQPDRREVGILMAMFSHLNTMLKRRDR